MTSAPVSDTSGAPSVASVSVAMPGGRAMAQPVWWTAVPAGMPTVRWTRSSSLPRTRVRLSRRAAGRTGPPAGKSGPWEEASQPGPAASGSMRSRSLRYAARRRAMWLSGTLSALVGPVRVE